MVLKSDKPSNGGNNELNCIPPIKSHVEIRGSSETFLDYCATHPNSGVRFVASDMILALHSDASYNSEPQSKIRAAGHYYLYKLNDENFNNGTLLMLSNIIKHVMTSASEAEFASLLYN